MPYQALHAKEITFKHPVSGQIMYFQTELPENFNGGIRWTFSNNVVFITHIPLFRTPVFMN
jgi:hypothetical protein